MNIEKIQINGHYVWVDVDAEIKEGDWFLNLDQKEIYKHTIKYYDISKSYLNKVIAASPELNLEGVPSYVEYLAEQESIRNEWNSEKSFITGYQTAEKELQKQLITEIMNDDAKDGLYEPQPTWDDVRKAIEMAREEIIRYRDNGWGVSEAHKLGYKMKEEEIIEQLKQSK